MTHKLGWLGAFFAAYTALIGSARADPARRADPAVSAPLAVDEAIPRRWYGWQTLALDGAAMGLGLGGARVAERHTGLGVALGGSGLVLYAFSAPTLYWVRGRPVAAGTSLALRVALPLVSTGVLVGADAGRCARSGEPEHTHFCDRMDDAVLIAATLSALAASAFDAAVLGWEPTPKPPRLSLSPVLAWDGRRGGIAGLGGSF